MDTELARPYPHDDVPKTSASGQARIDGAKSHGPENHDTAETNRICHRPTGASHVRQRFRLSLADTLRIGYSAEDCPSAKLGHVAAAQLFLITAVPNI